MRVQIGRGSAEVGNSKNKNPVETTAIIARTLLLYSLNLHFYKTKLSVTTKIDRSVGWFQNRNAPILRATDLCLVLSLPKCFSLLIADDYELTQSLTKHKIESASTTPFSETAPHCQTKRIESNRKMPSNKSSKSQNKKKERRLKSSNIHKILPEEIIEGLKNGSENPFALALNVMDPASIESSKKAHGRYVASVLAKMAFGVSKTEKVTDKSILIAIVKLSKELVHAIEQAPDQLNKSYMVRGKAAHSSYGIFRVLQKSHDDLLSSLTPTIVKLTGNPPEYHSTAYQTSLKKFMDICSAFTGEFILGEFNPARQEYFSMVHPCIGVQNGDDLLRETCWECGVSNRNDCFKCDRCFAARYCGPACQKKSWEEGHKSACKTTKLVYEVLQANDKHMREVLKAGSTGTSANIAPNIPIGYSCLEAFIRVQSQRIRSGEVFQVARLNILENFHQRIQAIANGGKHYAFPSLPKYKYGSVNRTRIPREEVQEAEINYISFAATFSFIGDELGFISDSTSENILVLKTIHPRGELMTSDRLLEIYTTYDGGIPGMPQLALCDMLRNIMFRKICRSYHKA